MRIALAAIAASIALVWPSVAAVAHAPSPAHHVVWLCRPGASSDPCVTPSATGKTSAFDCFYVYPTVSNETTANADLRIEPQEIRVARMQAAPFSTVCRVWAPMYRQVTLAAMMAGRAGNPANDLVAFHSLLAAWNDYITQHNHGRPIIFLGHSQGSQLLIMLLQRTIDDDPVLRSRMVSAILPGGNVKVRKGSESGGSFTHIALCRKLGQTGCVIAYSTFEGTPAATSFFGNPGQGLLPTMSHAPVALEAVACTNPAALAGGSAPLASQLGGATFRGLFLARCRSNGTATWLDVSRNPAYAGRVPRLPHSSPRFGLHIFDINIALGNLLDDVRAQERTFLTHGSR